MTLFRRALMLTLAAGLIACGVLPAPAAETGCEIKRPTDEKADVSQPVRVFIMMGQSNMLGFGSPGPVTKQGTLEYYTKKKGEYAYLIDDHNNWTQRKDTRYVFAMHRNGATRINQNQWLSPGHRFGPELGAGYLLGQEIDAPVLMLKVCIGNRSLGWDLLPPGSERFEHDGYIYAGYKDSPLKWKKGTKPRKIGWYAGKQYDDDVASAKRVLAEIEKYYPGAKNGYEVAGFLWWQGHKDQNPAHASRYEQNLVRLIKSLRDEFDAPDAPFVAATIAFDGKKLDGHGLTVAKAQLALNNQKKYPGLNARTVDARPFWRDKSESPSGQGYHYNHNAATYMDVGEAMGCAMVQMLRD